MKESQFSRGAREELNRHGIICYRIESHATSPGCPDIHYVGTHTSGWLETKVITGNTRKIPYRPKQPLWLVQYVRNGGRAWTLALLEKTRTVLLIPGSASIQATRDLRVCRRYMVSLDAEDAWERIAGLLFAALP